MQVTVYFVSTIPEQARKYILEKLKDLKNVELIFKTSSSEGKFLYGISRAEILIGWRPSKKLLLNAKNAQLFINPGAGIQHLIGLFRKINKERKLLLINGHGNSYFVAQHAVALLLTLMNKVIPHNEWMRNGRWRTGDEDATSIPLRFRDIGFLGYGAINQKIHRFLSGFDVKFSILRKHWEKQKSPLLTEVSKFEYPQLHEFLKRIDILFIGVPLTSMTRHLIKKRELELLGKEGLVVNIARGDIIDEESLYVSLKEKIINGAAIDVWYNYTPMSDKEGRSFPFDFPFHMLDNIILSPHRGYSPFSDLLRWDEVIENIKRMANDRSDFLNIVDLDEEY